jgi:nucleolar protein 12
VLSRKRRRIAPPDDIEGAYMKRLTDADDRIQTNLRHDARPITLTSTQLVVPAGTSEQGAPRESKAGENDAIPQHETLGGIIEQGATDKSDRTVFLGNVSIEAIKSKAARKVLLTHLSSCFSESQSSGESSKIESLRFRSTAFASGVGPKRAAYAKKELMEETTHSTHAYVVYITQEAAEKAAAFLNGTMVLDRHLRADYVARPAEIDHRRCVFVGNLGFVDEETIETETENGTKERRKRGKQPADVEEGLWRSFCKAGKIESVRVVRDKSTRVGKGIAYVQFYDENSVEAALLYNDKKFPPLLPRKLRITRARKANKIDKGKRSGETRVMPQTKSRKNSETDKVKSFVFEGYRATKQASHNSKGGVRRRKHVMKPTTRSSRRGMAFKAAGGKRQQK